MTTFDFPIQVGEKTEILDIYQMCSHEAKFLGVSKDKAIFETENAYSVCSICISFDHQSGQPHFYFQVCHYEHDKTKNVISKNSVDYEYQIPGK